MTKEGTETHYYCPEPVFTMSSSEDPTRSWVFCASRQMSNDSVRHQHVIHSGLPALPPPDPTGSRGSGVGEHKGLILSRKSQKPGTQIFPLPFPSSLLEDVMSELGHRELPSSMGFFSPQGVLEKPRGLFIFVRMNNVHHLMCPKQ